MSEYVFEKNNPGDTVQWVMEPRKIGDFRFTFDGKKIYHLFGDYPDKLTAEEKALFDKENPYWADFFGGT